MGFFDDVVTPDEPEQEQPEFVELGPPGADAGRVEPPVDWYVPAALPLVREVGAGAYARLMLTGFSVWPGSVTLHLILYRRRFRPTAVSRPFAFRRPGSSGPRFGLLLPDGRRVTTLDDQPWPAPPPGAEGRPQLTLQATGGGGGFHYGVELMLSALPPAGPLVLVVEWPEEGIAETRTDLDADAIRDATARVVEVWPSLKAPPPGQSGRVTRFGFVSSVTPRGLMAGPAGGMQQLTAVARPQRAPAGRATVGDPARYEPRPDWDGIGFRDWTDLRLIRARLDAGADPERPINPPSWGPPLHEAASLGSAEVVAELLARVADVDAPDENGRSALWHAVCHGNEPAVRALLDADADPWPTDRPSPSPGRLALHTPLAPLVADRPGAVPLTDAEQAAQAEADRRIAVFAGVYTEGLGVAFVADLDEDELIRRLGADPADCPVLHLDRAPGPYGTGPGGFDPHDYDAALQFVGITAVPGGCVLTQPTGYRPSEPALLTRISAGTVAYGLYFNPADGHSGILTRDRRIERTDDLAVLPEDTPDYWRYRFWQKGPDAPYRARDLAYAATATGLTLTTATPVTGPPRRWIKLPTLP